MHNARIAIFSALLLCFTLTGSWAAPKQGDKDRLQGIWVVSEGVYPDKSLERELEMSFSFKGDSMTNPMDDSVLDYALDEKAKTISAKGNGTSMKLTYRILDDKTMELLSLVVAGKDGKSMEVVGPNGSFISMKLVKK